ncbi:metallophosphoesterase family protein [Bacillus sp. SJS]|uniref:metallophosphoesterase family protein n=1 Tax=Bacillus sp. SJS TaxID=1423321 RepID=UPI0004DD8EBE|nr:metallophosphoesterase family protein [Bacillus sp. SJS]KZZ83539.1 serine/threonine protein phosphatase [Bacillus sp. SJS]
MNRIAVISDIHGNVPALEAVLDDIHYRRIEKIICLGDLVGKGPQSHDAIAMVRKHCEITVKGNWDDFITKDSEFETLKWHQNQLTDEDRRYLTKLPFSAELTMSGRLIRLFHASPYSIYTRIQPWDSIERRMSMFEDTEMTGKSSKRPDVAGYGDVHQAFVHQYKEKMLFNTGSVGNPLDMTQASYAVLEGLEGEEAEGPFSIQLIRVPYDIERSIRIAREADMPDLKEYIQELTTAKYRGLS